MKHLLITTIAAVVLLGCGTGIYEAAAKGNIEVVKQHLAAGADVNAKGEEFGDTPLDWAIDFKRIKTADLLRKHGGKTGEELKAEGN